MSIFWDVNLPTFTLVPAAMYLAKLPNVTSLRKATHHSGNFTFETLNLHARESTLEKIVPQGLIRNTVSLENVKCDGSVYDVEM